MVWGAPNVCQYADKFYNCRIITRWSKVARWIRTQIAQAVARKENSKLKKNDEIRNQLDAQKQLML